MPDIALNESFGSSIPVPAKLSALVKAIDDGTFDAYHLSGSFRFGLESLGSLASWFSGPALTPSATYASKKLAVFGSNPDGSMLAIWQAPDGGYPVVFFGSEGQLAVLAENFNEFLRLLAIGYDELGPGSWDEPPEASDDPPDDLEDCINPAFQEWVRNQGLDIPKTGADIISVAAARYPDFPGWCAEASEGTLSAEADDAVRVEKHKLQEKPASPSSDPYKDLWELMVAAIGKRIDSPEVHALIEAIGAKPLKVVAPNIGKSAYTTSKGQGVKVVATSAIYNRAYWPPRKEKRIYATYVYSIEIGPSYRGLLPHGLRWGMTRADLEKVGVPKQRKFSPRYRDDLQIVEYEWEYWSLPPPRDDVVLEAEEGAMEHVALRVPEEKEFVTVLWNDDNENRPFYVERSFFVTWCALNGVLDPEKFTSAIIQPLRDRLITPVDFLWGPCKCILWESDVHPDFIGFMFDYFGGRLVPDWRRDSERAFGRPNFMRSKEEAKTQDGWENYDRIAPVITSRFGEWQRGELKEPKR